MIDIDPEKLYAWNLSAADVSAAVSAQNLIAPSGTAKIGEQEYNVRLNNSRRSSTKLRICRSNPSAREQFLCAMSRRFGMALSLKQTSSESTENAVCSSRF